MAQSFERLWSGERKTADENEKEAKKCTNDASYPGEFLRGVKRNRAEKIQFNSSMKATYFEKHEDSWQRLLELVAMEMKIRGWTPPSSVVERTKSI